MALAAGVAQRPRPSWNPFRIGGSALEPNVLLAAKLIALCLLLTNHQRLLPAEPFLPFLPFLDVLRAPFPFEIVVKTLFFGSLFALLFNRAPRASALMLGGTILLCVISSKAYYGNNKLFCAAFLILAGLTKRGEEPWLLRWQLVIVYAGAALNKWLDPDWLSGQFFEYWGRHRVEEPLFIVLSDALPPLWAGKLFCWLTIGIETALAVGFAVRRLWAKAIWLGILFHTSAMWFTGSVFTMFFYAMNASYLVFASWPRERIVALYDGDCGVCEKTRRFFERIDFEQVYDWRPFQTGAGARWGIAKEALERRMHVIAAGRTVNGFHALQLLTLYNPLFYFVAAALLAAPRGEPSTFRNVTAGVLIALFFPMLRPVGQSLYGRFARNRHRLPGADVCETGPAPGRPSQA